jgi:predicted DNA-binding transcriptional regulator YafY
VPIWAEPGRTGGYCIDPLHTLAPLGFTAEEALAVSIGLGMLSSSPFHASAALALRKVVAVMDEPSLRKTAELAQRIHLLDDGSAPVVAADLEGALTSGKVLRIVYRDRDGAQTTRHIEPLGFVGQGRDWYLIAWCRLRNGIRAFRGDRISRAEPTGERRPMRTLDTSDIEIAYGELRPITIRENGS